MSAVEQYTAAFARGQAVRLARAAERRRVHALTRRAGMRAVSDLIAEPPEHMTTARVAEVLCWPCHSQGRIANQIIRLAHVSEFATIGALTYRQRAALVEDLDERYQDRA